MPQGPDESGSLREGGPKLLDEETRAGAEQGTQPGFLE